MSACGNAPSRAAVGLLAALLLSACLSETRGITDVARTGVRYSTTSGEKLVITATTDTAVIGILGGSVPITVHVADTTGRPLLNQIVTFTSASGNGRVIRNGAATTSVNTNGNGDVVATWSFGTLVGEQRLRATVKNGVDTVWFVATLPTPAALSAVSATQISGTFGGSTLVSVLAVDSTGDPFPFATVRFLVGARNGKVSALSGLTDRDGTARTTWTFDSASAGRQVLLATVDGTSDTVEFRATVPGPPQPADLVAGGTVTLSGTTNGSAPISVIVLDSNRAPVRDALVTFTALANSGTVVAGTARSSRDGVITATWRFGATAGSQRLIVTANGLSDTLRFVSTVRVPPVATFLVASGATSLTGAAGTYRSVALRVLDGDSLPFANATVRFRIASGGGYLATDFVKSDRNGNVTVAWMLGGRPLGTQLLTAELIGARAPLVTFTAQVTVGAPAAVSIVSGNNQTARAGDTLSLSPTVKVVDNYGNLVANATVLCAVTAGGGSIANASVTTNSSGVALCGRWVLGSAVGAHRMTATVAISGGRATVNFAATSQR